MVDGVSNHQAMIDVAFGRTPQLSHRTGPYGLADQMVPAPLRRRHGAVRALGRADRRARARLPGTTVRVTAIPGEQLSKRHAEDAYSSVLASVLYRREGRGGDRARLSPLPADPDFRDR